MRALVAIATAWMLAIPAARTAAAAHADMLASEPCPADDGDYAQYLDRQLATYRQESAAAARQGMTFRDEAAARAGLLTRREYAARHGRNAVSCMRLTYRSDGLKVIGFIWRSRHAVRQPQPIIIFNRGGVREDSKLRPNTQFGFWRFVTDGFVVVGSQYRGNDGGEGQDEMGGADVRDVLKLIEIAKSLDGVDPDNVFALGYSRGAMQSLLAARQGAGFRAIATVGLPADLQGSYAANPGSGSLFSKLIPNFSANPEAALQVRSPLSWAEDVNAPLLMIAGAADPLVATHANSIRLAARLGELKKPYELVVYDGDSHGVMINARDRDRRIIEWFRRHARRPPDPR